MGQVVDKGTGECDLGIGVGVWPVNILGASARLKQVLIIFKWFSLQYSAIAGIYMHLCVTDFANIRYNYPWLGLL